MILCNIDSSLKKINIFKNDELVEAKSFDEIQFKEEADLDAKTYNCLKLLSKASLYLKLNHNAKNEDCLIMIDNEDLYKLLKPNDVIINKLSKSMKKNIKNNELKFLLGSTLSELQSVQNVDIQLNTKDIMKGDDTMLKNTSITGSGLSLKNFKPIKLNLDSNEEISDNVTESLESVNPLQDNINMESSFSFEIDENKNGLFNLDNDTINEPKLNNSLSFNTDIEDSINGMFSTNTNTELNFDNNSIFNIDEEINLNNNLDNYSSTNLYENEESNSNGAINFDNNLELNNDLSSTIDMSNDLSFDMSYIDIENDLSINMKEESIDESAEMNANLEMDTNDDLSSDLDNELNLDSILSLNDDKDENENLNNIVEHIEVPTLNLEEEEIIFEEKATEEIDENLIEETTSEMFTKEENKISSTTTEKATSFENQLAKELSNMEAYIDEQLNSLNEEYKKLEEENLNLAINLNDLNIDEDVIIESFNKSMEVRLRLKVIKKSCKIYTNLKKQLQNDLSKF